MSRFILAIDQGTTSTRAIAFDEGFRPRAVAQKELKQIYPKPGWVEHDPDEIWAATLEVCRAVIDEIGGVQNIACIGITNQRETTIIWDRKTGAVVHNAIVWQDRRTADVCAALAAHGVEEEVQALTGLVLDPYFSATKIAHILESAPDLKQRAEAGELAFGTVECFLLWRLTEGRVHASDATNASRTQLLDIQTGQWSDALCALYGVPRALLPEVKPCDAHFGETALFGAAIPITGMAGDQQAALVGQACLSRGMAKATYGTGCFLVMNMGESMPHSQHRLLATIAYETKAAKAFALEGSIFSAGATMQWLRDGLKAIAKTSESEAIAAALKDNGGVYLVPAFAGLGAPHWNAEARGAILGLTRDSTAAHIVRAGLEANAYQTHDLLDALANDGAPKVQKLLVDGGLTANGWAMQFLADICETEIVCPEISEATALGAAKLAALGAGLLPDLADAPAAEIKAAWAPRMKADERARLLTKWQAALNGVLAAH